MATAMPPKGEIERPMMVTEKLFLYEIDEATNEKYQYDPAYGGKWILILPNSSMDETWAQCCRLYRNGQFPGIAYMKTSTSAYNPRQFSDHSGVIMFHCGPSNDKGKMMSYGYNIADTLQCYSVVGHLPYKSDKQSEKGTRATGNNDNSLYYIDLPKKPRCQLTDITRRSDCSMLPNQGSTPDSSSTHPSEEFQVFWLHERILAICGQYNYNLDESGYWLMVFNKAWLDKNWRTACQKYRAKELTGIHSLCVSTARHRGEVYENTGVILFYCGPSGNPDLIKSYGENLSNLMRYLDESGRMTYWVDNPRRVHLHVETPKPWQKKS